MNITIEIFEVDEERVVRLQTLRKKLRNRLNGLKLALWNGTSVSLSQIIACQEALDELDEEIESFINS